MEIAVRDADGRLLPAGRIPVPDFDDWFELLESSPVSAVDTWKSPVLFIHGDDDRNVYFTQTVDLIARLRARGGVTIEQLIFPDEIHDLLLHRDWLTAYEAEADFFERYLKHEMGLSKAAQATTTAPGVN